MITGHNTDITYNGVIYHVQTEDKGQSNPVVETLVYRGGEILDARRTSYQELLKDGYDEKRIVVLIDEQHTSVITEIKDGKYDRGGAALRLDPLGEEIVDASKSLDQVILDYLASAEQKERLTLELKGVQEYLEGAPCSVNILATSGTSGEPFKGAKIILKIISTVKKPLTVYEGKTDRNGMLIVQFVMPEFPDGNAALLIQAFSDIGTDEIKQLVKKRKKVGNAGKTV